MANSKFMAPVQPNDKLAAHDVYHAPHQAPKSSEPVIKDAEIISEEQTNTPEQSVDTK